MIIDCFTFFDELDLLELRLHELCDVVDVFVLTESPKTFTGDAKPLYFEKNRGRFREFDGKIVHTVYDDCVVCRPEERERRQKQFNIDVAFDYLYQAGDVVIQGDCDEIPKASVLKKVLTEDWGTARFVLILCYYWLNCRERHGKKLFKNSFLSRTGRYEYNAKQNTPADKTYWNAGWHFSHLGDIQKKLAAWGHATEYNRPPFNTKEHIEKCRQKGTDLFMRKGQRKLEFDFVFDLSFLPEYVLENMERFGKYIYEG